MTLYSFVSRLFSVILALRFVTSSVCFVLSVWATSGILIEVALLSEHFYSVGVFIVCSECAIFIILLKSECTRNVSALD
jgi:hypothetical protein